MEWQDVEHCNHCRGTERSVYLDSAVPKWYEGRNLVLYECKACRLVYASPRPEPRALYAKMMAGKSFAQQITKRKLERPNVLDIHRQVVVDAIKHLNRPAKTLFDVGCGAGTVLMAARELGLQAGGNDVNGHSTKVLREMGFDTACAFTQDLKVVKQYDIVTSLDYLEHSYTPWDDLRFMHRLLAPQGILHIKTLYLGCPKHQAEGEGWRLFGMGHFHFFWPDVLDHMVEEAGFEIIDSTKVQLIKITARKLP